MGIALSSTIPLKYSEANYKNGDLPKFTQGKRVIKFYFILSKLMETTTIRLCDSTPRTAKYFQLNLGR